MKEMLTKGTIQKVKSEPAEFLSNLLLVHKTDEGHRPVINLKFLNSFIPEQHFKMEDFQNDSLTKTDIKYDYFGIPEDKTQENIFVFNEKETYTNSFAYALTWVQPL